MEDAETIIKYSFPQKVFMLIICLISDLTFFPCVALMKHQERYFYFYVFYFSLIGLILYHITNIYNIELFVRDEKWFQIFEIGALECINGIILSCNKFCFDLDKQEKLGYFIFYFIMIFQKIKPQFFIHKTISIFISIAICLYLNYKYGRPKSYTHNFSYALLFGLINLFFLHLSYNHPYLKICQCLCIICFSLFCYFSWNSQVEKKPKLLKMMLNGLIIYPIEKTKTLVN